MTINVRFVERDLNENWLAEQREALKADANLYELDISPIGIEMLTALVGKGMTPSQRAVVGGSLHETMHGEIPMQDTATGDMFAEVYGEVFGPLFTCLTRDGAFEIIRLIPPPGMKCPDFLLLDRGNGLLILQECKGMVPDYHTLINRVSPFDLCRSMRRRRRDGESQLVWPRATSISDTRIRVTGAPLRYLLPLRWSEESVAVTAVPDGRLNRPQVRLAAPEVESCPNSCLGTCMFRPNPNLVSVLSSRQVGGAVRVGDGERDFMQWYKACERAIWGRAHASFGPAFGSMVGAWQHVDLPDDYGGSPSPLFIGLVHAAVESNVFVDFDHIIEVSHQLEDRHLMDALYHLQHYQGEMPPPHVRKTDSRHLGRALFGTHEEPSVVEHAVGNWTLHSRRPASEEGTALEANVRSTRPAFSKSYWCLAAQQTPMRPWTFAGRFPKFLREKTLQQSWCTRCSRKNR